MGKLSEFYIVINDNENRVYNPGQIIHGKVVATLTEMMEMRGW